MLRLGHLHCHGYHNNHLVKVRRQLWFGYGFLKKLLCNWKLETNIKPMCERVLLTHHYDLLLSWTVSLYYNATWFLFPPCYIPTSCIGTERFQQSPSLISISLISLSTYRSQFVTACQIVMQHAPFFSRDTISSIIWECYQPRFTGWMNCRGTACLHYDWMRYQKWTFWWCVLALRVWNPSLREGFMNLTCVW